MAKVYIHAFGCSTNISESEAIAGLLSKAGFKIVDSLEKSDLAVISICVVKSPSETSALRLIGRAKQQGKKIIVSGCISEAMIPRIRKIAKNASLVSTHNIEGIAGAAEEALNGNTVELLSKKSREKICLPKIRRSNVIGIVPISSGCNSACTYCSVRLVKGKLFSYPFEKIIEEVKNCISDGCSEIWITSQDTAAYMIDQNGKSMLTELLKEICSIDGKFMVRVGMMNPNNLMPVMNEMAKAFRHEKMFKFLHIPVQSGNGEILKKMGRKYSVADFKRIVSFFRKKVPDLTISTDIICGFPSETEKQFSDSLKLIKEIKPDVLNISRYWSRPGTAAAGMKQHPGSLTKDRSREMTRLFEGISLKNNQKWIGWKGEIIIDEKGKKPGTWIGRNSSYKPVVVESRKNLLGKFLKVKINGAGRYDLRGA